jgi:biopolymer transport protein ExbD
MKVGGSGALASEINVTPMIDVLLVLLMVFLLTTQIRMTLSLNVPPPAASDSRRPLPQVVVDLKSDGSYALNSEPVTRANLPGRLRTLYAGTGRQVLYIRATAGRRYREVIAVVDLAKGAGVPVIGYMP